jgi:hypothetical protein
MKIIVTLRKPRNPLVAVTHLRHAGKHMDRSRSMRARDARAHRRELERIKDNPQ